MLKIAWSPLYKHPVPEGHRFPMMKYELIPEWLLWNGIVSTENIFEPKLASEQTILLTHDETYYHHLIHQTLDAKHVRRVGFALTPLLVQRELCLVQGSVDCALYALQYGVAMNVAGGTHHAFTNRGEGFCLLNDFAVAANYLLNEQLAKRVLIVDLDVHQGNGTAQIFSGRDNVYTFSMHAKSNYPFIKEKSDCDVELPDGMNGDEYLNVLQQQLPATINRFKPDFIFYLSGVDVLETDKLGKLKLTKKECYMRDFYVLNLCKQYKIPVCVAMGGGYSPLISDVVEAHCNTFKAASEIFFG